MPRVILKVWEEALSKMLRAKRDTSILGLNRDDNFEKARKELFTFWRQQLLRSQADNSLLKEFFGEKPDYFLEIEKGKVSFIDVLPDQEQVEKFFWNRIEYSFTNWAKSEGKFPEDWQNSIQQDLKDELKQKLFHNFSSALKKELKESERAWKSFEFASSLQTVSMLQSLTSSIDQIKNDSSNIKKDLAELNDVLPLIRQDILTHFEELENSVKEFFTSNQNINVLLIDFRKEVTGKLTDIGKGVDETKDYAKQAAENTSKLLKQVSLSLPSNIPLLTKGFVGRREELKDLLRLKDRGTTAFVLWGMAGVGKTQLALRFIQEVRNEFDAHIRVDLRGLTDPLTATQIMFEVVKEFDREASVNLSDSQIASRFSFFINKHKTILFFDNAKDEFQFSTLNIQNCFLIVTSRENLLMDGGETKKIGVLSEEDAQDLLFSIANERLFKGRDKELAELVGRLPIALKPLASLLAKRLIDIEDLIKEYKLERKSLELKDPLQGGFTIQAVFALSERFLDEELKKFWVRIGVFPSDFDIGAAAFVSGTEPADSKKKLRRLTSKSLAELIELNLIERDKTIEVERYRLHDLVRAYVQDKIDKVELQTLQKLHASYFARLLKPLMTYNLV